MEFFYIKDGHDRIEDFTAAAQSADVSEIQRSAQFAKQLRDYHWDNRRITSHGTYYGGAEYQWLAHVPGKLVKILDVQHPGWDQDERTMRKILSLYPQSKVLPEETR